MAMTGVILCGGQSRRMGRDKGLLLAENKTWVRHAFNKLQPVCDNVVISVNPSQKKTYSTEFESVLLVEDNAAVDVRGPLHGLFSVHMKFPNEDLLVLACDMVAMNGMVLENLRNTFSERPGYEAYVYSSDDGYQPVVGIYTSGLLSKLLQEYKAGNLHKYSLKHVLENTSVCFIPVSEEWEAYFLNYNYKEDIDFQ